MKIAAIAFLIIYGLVLVVWLARWAFVARLGRQIPQLRRGDPQTSAKHHTLLSVLIPAKDEENTIGPCLRSVLAQTYAHLEVLVIDDRSRDGTAEVVRHIAQSDRRVRLLHTHELPPDWTGKTYALWLGASEARGRWLWFLDADTCHVPENLAVVLEHARRHHADLVTLLPALESRTFWERVVQPLAAVLLMKLHNLRGGAPRGGGRASLRGWKRHPAHALPAAPHGAARGALHGSSDGFANGQYILIRRRVYRAIGGHRRVRDRFLEDVELGRVVKAEGYKVEVVFGKELTRARMYDGGKQLVHGWSRILYGTAHNRPARLVATGLGLWAFSCSAFFVLAGWLAVWAGSDTGLAAPWLRATCAMNVVHLGLMLSTMGTLYNLVGSRRRWLAFYPLACLAMSWIVLRALWMCFTHRVSWRGRHYHRAAGRSARPSPRKSSVLMHQHHTDASTK